MMRPTLIMYVKTVFFKSANLTHFDLTNVENKMFAPFDFIVNHIILLIQYIPFELYRLTKINPAIFADESFSKDNSQKQIYS